MQAARGASLTSPSEPEVDRPLPRRRVGILLTVASVALALDLVTKLLVVARLEGRPPVRLLGGALLLDVSRNPGAAFSFATGATWVFTVIAVTVIVVIGFVARRLRSVAWAWALGLLVGGAAGNLVDRVFRSPGPGRGAVVDFLDFRVWPVFNLADSAIVVGGMLAVLLSFRGVELDGRPRSTEPAEPAEPAEPGSPS